MKPPLRILQGVYQPERTEILRAESDIELSDIVTEPLYEALIDPEMQVLVDADTKKLSHTIFNNPAYKYLPTRIDLTKIDKDMESLLLFSRDNEFVFVPGLIGLESFDYSSDHIEDKKDIVRLYCGVMLAHQMILAKYQNEDFFKLVFNKQFAMKRRTAGDRIDTFSRSLDDPVILARHQSIMFASFASGTALATLFEKEQRGILEDVLCNRYEVEHDDIERTHATAGQKLLVPESNIPSDEFPAETRGFAYPLGSQEINTVLHGKITR